MDAMSKRLCVHCKKQMVSRDGWVWTPLSGYVHLACYQPMLDKAVEDLTSGPETPQEPA